MHDVHPIIPSAGNLRRDMLLIGAISVGVLVVPPVLLAFLGVPDRARPAVLGLLVFPMVLITVAMLTVFAKCVRAARTARFVVRPDGLSLEGDIWGRRIPLAALRVTEARVVDAEQEPAFAPLERQMGTELSGYRAGWFRLRNAERALVYVTDRRRLAYIPTTQGYSLLLSVADPAALLDSLARAAGSGVRSGRA